MVELLSLLGIILAAAGTTVWSLEVVRLTQVLACLPDIPRITVDDVVLERTVVDALLDTVIQTTRPELSILDQATAEIEAQQDRYRALTMRFVNNQHGMDPMQYEELDKLIHEARTEVVYASKTFGR